MILWNTFSHREILLSCPFPFVPNVSLCPELVCFPSCPQVVRFPVELRNVGGGWMGGWLNSVRFPAGCTCPLSATPWVIAMSLPRTMEDANNELQLNTKLQKDVLLRMCLFALSS